MEEYLTRKLSYGIPSSVRAVGRERNRLHFQISWKLRRPDKFPISPPVSLFSEAPRSGGRQSKSAPQKQQQERFELGHHGLRILGATTSDVHGRIRCCSIRGASTSTPSWRLRRHSSSSSAPCSSTQWCLGKGEQLAPHSWMKPLVRFTCNQIITSWPVSRGCFNLPLNTLTNQPTDGPYPNSHRRSRYARFYCSFSWPRGLLHPSWCTGSRGHRSPPSPSSCCCLPLHGYWWPAPTPSSRPFFRRG